MAQKTQNQSTKNTAKQTAGSTQTYLNIAEIKDGVVVLKDGSIRSVLMTSAINFALKSGGEQDAIIYGYQRFLNSLTFPVQILVQSRRLDLDLYIDRLNKRAEEVEMELIKLQILEYAEFIKRLISVTNIMDKRFYVVVPFFPEGTQQLKGISKFFATSAVKKGQEQQANDAFERNKVQLMQRVESIASALGAMGLRAVNLNSEELVELFYSIYNPSTSTKQRLLNVDELTAASIERDYHDTPIAQFGSVSTEPAGSSTPEEPVEPEIPATPTVTGLEFQSTPAPEETPVEAVTPNVETASSEPATATAPTPAPVEPPVPQATTETTPPPVAQTASGGPNG